jgi:NTE family protein
VPFIAVATDLSNGARVVIKEGSMRDALSASSSVPGVLDPVKYREKYLVDGILSDNVPVREVKKMGAKKILAVHVTPSISFKELPKGRIDVLLKSFLLMLNRMSLGSGDEAYLLLEPGLEAVPYADFRYARLCADLGEKTASENIEKIKKMVSLLDLLFR